MFRDCVPQEGSIKGFVFFATEVRKNFNGSVEAISISGYRNSLEFPRRKMDFKKFIAEFVRGIVILSHKRPCFHHCFDEHIVFVFVHVLAHFFVKQEGFL